MSEVVELSSRHRSGFPGAGRLVQRQSAGALGSVEDVGLLHGSAIKIKLGDATAERRHLHGHNLTICGKQTNRPLAKLLVPRVPSPARAHRASSGTKKGSGVSVAEIESAIYDILTNTPGSPARETSDDTRASHDYLLAQGDLAVPHVVSGIEKRATLSVSDEDYQAFWGIHAAIRLLAELNTRLSRSGLLKLLNTSWPPNVGTSIYRFIFQARASSRDAGTEVIPALIEAANGPAVQQRRENIVDIYLLARKLGGRIPVSAGQAVEIAAGLTFNEEALQVIDDFLVDMVNWPSGRRAAFFWFYGIRVATVRGKANSLPYFAASVLADPGKDAVAWSKLPGVTRSAQEAVKLTRKYPLPQSLAT